MKPRTKPDYRPMVRRQVSRCFCASCRAASELHAAKAAGDLAQLRRQVRDLDLRGLST
jgi:hypothetical protein